MSLASPQQPDCTFFFSELSDFSMARGGSRFVCFSVPRVFLLEKVNVVELFPMFSSSNFKLQVLFLSFKLILSRF